MPLAVTLRLGACHLVTLSCLDRAQRDMHAIASTEMTMLLLYAASAAKGISAAELHIYGRDILREGFIAYYSCFLNACNMSNTMHSS